MCVRKNLSVHGSSVHTVTVSFASAKVWIELAWITSLSIKELYICRYMYGLSTAESFLLISNSLSAMTVVTLTR